MDFPSVMPSVITLKITDGLPVGNVPAGNFFLARVSVCITVSVSVGEWFFLFATDLATKMGFTDDCFTDGLITSVRPSVLFSPTDCIAVTDGINPSVKLDNVVVNYPKKKKTFFDNFNLFIFKSTNIQN